VKREEFFTTAYGNPQTKVVACFAFGALLVCALASLGRVWLSQRQQGFNGPLLNGAFDGGLGGNGSDDEFCLSDDGIGPAEVESVAEATKEAEAFNPFDISDAEQYVVRKARDEEDEEGTSERATLLD
jgi:hypothetical protein